jgi:hypothetical protein
MAAYSHCDASSRVGNVARKQGVQQPQRYCTNCGAEVRPGTAFCVSCGTNLTPGAVGPDTAGSEPPPQGRPSSLGAGSLRQMAGLTKRWFENLPSAAQIVLAVLVLVLFLTLLSPRYAVLGPRCGQPEYQTFRCGLVRYT